MSLALTPSIIPVSSALLPVFDFWSKSFCRQDSVLRQAFTRYDKLVVNRSSTVLITVGGKCRSKCENELTKHVAFQLENSRITKSLVGRGGVFFSLVPILSIHVCI